MANYTEHYNFIKPLDTEGYDVSVANTNSGIADNILYSKVDKVAGKDLSTNDFTNAYKKKIDSMQTLYRFKDSVETVNDLSSIENKNIGDVYKCKADSHDYCWNGEEWVDIGTNNDFSEILDNLGTNNGDSLPIGTIVEYEGTTVPDGYEEVEENEIVVSAEEPTENRKRVWIQKGKNLFDKNNANKFYGYFSATAGFDSAGNNDPNKTFYIECIPNCTYTVSKIAGERFRVGTSKNIPKAGESLTEVKTNTKGTQLTITSGTEDKYLSVYYMDITADTLTEQEILDSIQIEQGSTATSYEQYVENKIFIKNKNDVYEEFMKKKDNREWIVLNETYGVKYRKIDDDVELSLWDNSHSTYAATTTKVFGKLPSDYSPNINIRVPVYVAGGSSAFYLQINTDGTVFVFNWGAEKQVESMTAYIKYTV